MASVVFRSSVIIFLLLVFNGGSIALGALPYFYGPAQAFQILQLGTAAAAFILALLLPCFVIAKHGRGVYTESIIYLLITLLDIVPAVFITIRWLNHKLEKDYSNVPKRKMIVVMAVSAFWAASLTGFIGFFLAMVDACRRAIHKDKYRYDGRAPPRELQSAPYAQPFTTTYARP
ncbi:hypothetical protein ACEPAG_5409 [Sanghuangporus baumii]